MKRKNLLFVTGTDTEVGKTIISSALFRNAVKQGLKTAIIKPIQTGYNPIDITGPSKDIDIYNKAVSDLTNECEVHCLEYLKAPCSPDLASRLEGHQINPDGLLAKIEEIRTRNNLTIVEGSGGILVPIDANGFTMLNLMTALAGPILLVTENRLGAINNTLLSINELRRNGLVISALVMNQPHFQNSHSQYILEDNIKQISQRTGIKCLVVPFLEHLSSKATMNATDFDPISNLLDDIIFYGNHTEAPQDIISFDRKHLLHPYDCPKNPQPVEQIIYARDCELYTANGKQLIDGISSWWATIHGHNNGQLNDHLKSQIDKFSHVMFGGFTHEPAVKLCENLLEIVPKNLQKVFYSDSGSVAVEVAMKMAVQYWQGVGNRQKTKFLSLAGGYHGDTLWAMSVCDPTGGMHRSLASVLPKQVFLPKPSYRFGEVFDIEEETRKYENFFAAHSQELAGMIFEPVAQCAGGFWFYSKEYLEIFRNLCTKYDILLVADEIATGFGRTGRMFACDFARIQPDIMCLGKGLTGGALSLGVTLTTEKITDGICNQGQVILHGPTFMANPLACAAGIASLSLLSSQDWHGRVMALQNQMINKLSQLNGFPGVKDLRILGSIGVIEMDKPVDRERFTSFCHGKGIGLRPIGNLIYTMPPYTITPRQFDKILDTILEYLAT
ncbi:MAG: adenosylmethionine--8-amino-7-oxononanoate transaminase [Puniceicoccales bacterium]|jgi:adenosylmethionine-8-amino-7-oxononanoate aminotransferase|nr:adenosylmethionine--8-amino-7-oxononanoate transaminase [Puniceicoccales bacterium]